MTRAAQGKTERRMAKLIPARRAQQSAHALAGIPGQRPQRQARATVLAAIRTTVWVTAAQPGAGEAGAAPATSKAPLTLRAETRKTCLGWAFCAPNNQIRWPF